MNNFDEIFLKRVSDSIRSIPDFPKPGIIFRDITTLLNSGDVFCELIDKLKNRYQNMEIDYIVGIESRGFMFGAALAYALRIGFVPVRKKGKLPSVTASQKYSLEYGESEVEIHIDAFKKRNPKIIMVDDLIATGGTAEASVNLIKDIGGECMEAIFLLNLKGLGGEEKIKKLTKVFSILDID